MDLFASPVLLALTKQLDSAALTQRVIAHNVANVNTPGYKKSYVSFQEQLKAALGKQTPGLLTSHPRHIGAPVALENVAPRVAQEQDTTMRYGQNNVDVDQEMVNLAANSLLYDASARVLGDKLSGLGYVIRGGR